ncbi:DUF2332 domain-containing protein [Pseudoroseicyclus tamaricis]|uniref:DUF2332 family protein n=1 Tax=Pseudoroseicyclus tamaricis TaxID=2705421 RepID=A0A6B2JU09_9RHOB|nr:DUF2332 family protein [Pseudoroseicyclus tamaricis]NDV01425.1 DUF2332 family protein [Pseudoroseicyclus tamaricis]
MTGDLTERLAQAFDFQAHACEDLGSPFMGRLCRLLPGLLPAPLLERVAGMEGDLGPRGQSVPLRLCGALHALRLQGRAGLAKVYPPEAADDPTLAAALSHALEAEAEFIHGFIHSPPQTNEVRRSCALLPAAAWLSARRALPLTLSELGASAGLNLHFGEFALETPAGRIGAPDPALVLTPEWRGEAPIVSPIEVAGGAGADLSPIDPVEDRLRLLSYLWPDQPERLELTEAALTLPPARVDKADAADWIEARLAEPRPGHWHLIYHTIAWQYFPAPVQERAEAAIRGAGARATAEAPLAWLAMEQDGGRPGAGLRLRLWDGGAEEDHLLARVDFHGRWIDWQGALPAE